MKHRKIILLLLTVLLGVSSVYAQQFRAALPSPFSNESPGRFCEGKTCTVRSFTNPVNFSCYAHVIHTESGNIVIDPGYYDGDLKDYVNSIGGVDTILLTHCHVDHIIGLDALKKDYPDAKVYIHALDHESLYSIYANYSFERVISEPLVIESDSLPLDAGDYEFSGQKVRVIHSPGHSPGSALYYFPDEGLLFLGDTIAFHKIPRYDLANSNVPALMESLTKLKNLGLPEDTTVFFGHGERVSYGEMLSTFDCFTKTLTLSFKANEGETTDVEDVYFEGDTLMLPADLPAKILNTPYIPDKDSAVIYLPNMTRLKVRVGGKNPDAELDGFTVNMTSPAQLKDGKIYMPGKFLEQVFKGFIAWELSAK